MYLRCRPPIHSHELKEVGSSPFSSLAVQQLRRRPSQHRPYSQTAQQKREHRRRTGGTLTSRLFHSTSVLANSDGQTNVAVVGGGITGLTAAYKISRDPNARVTLYESSSKLGGWMRQTERVKADGGDVLFEYGPRSFRSDEWGSYSMLNLLLDLGMKDQIISTSKDSSAARERYIYYHNRLLRLLSLRPPPNTSPSKWLFFLLANIIAEPAFRNIVWEGIKEHFGYKSEGRKRGNDESISDLVSRKISPSVADDFISASMHGIFAGDIDKLSAKAILYSIWYMDQESPSIFTQALQIARRKVKLVSGEAFDAIVLRWKDTGKEEGSERVKEYLQMTKNTSVFTLKGGMSQLVGRLEDALADAKNVEVKTGVQIEKISGSSKSQMEVRLPDGSSEDYDHVISTTSPRQLAKQLEGPSENSTSQTNDVARLLNSEGTDYAVTVMVINLYYENPNLLPVNGFGYLIPRSVPLSQNPERALGVIFGSEVGAGQDTSQGTKLTVMMGGHWWDGWKESDYPDEKTAVEMARKLLKRHLNVSEIPSVTGARLQRNAIPQPTVGHCDRMAQLDRALRRDYGDKLKVGGAWYTGVGLNDCIRSGELHSLRLRHRDVDGSSGTGLGVFSAGEGFDTPSSPLRAVNPQQFWATILLDGKQPLQQPPEKNKTEQKD